jgi:hypothetical protein
MVRRLKQDVLKELPPKTSQILEISANGNADLVAEEKQIYEGYREFIEGLEQNLRHAELEAEAELEDYACTFGDDEVAAMRKEIGKAKKTLFEETAKTRKKIGLAKVPHVVDHLENVLEQGAGPVLVHAYHRDVQDQYKAHFGDRARVMNGSTPMEERQQMIDDFQAGKFELFFSNIREGYTVTRSSLVVIAEEEWNPSRLNQFVDRCILEGQPILTDRGWEPIEKVATGRMIVSHDGLLHKVVDRHSRKAKSSHAVSSKNIVEINVRGWLETIKVTHDHKILTDRGWMEAQDIRPRDRLIMPKPYQGQTSYKRPVEESCRIPDMFETAEMELFGDYYEVKRIRPASKQKNNRLIKLPENMDTRHESMWIFGYYMGDGFSSTRHGKGQFVSLSGNKGKKSDCLQRGKNWAGRIGITGSIYDDADSEGSELRMFSGELAKWFSRHFGETLRTKSVPEWVFELDREQRVSFIEGWMDADGYKRKGRNELITASKRLAADATRLLMSIGEKPCVNYGEHSRCYSIGWTEGEEQKLIVTSVLQRTCNNTEKVYDLTVEGSHTFVVGTAVVHNCHRIGQRKSVLVQHIVFEDSLDIEMLTMTFAKQQVIDAVLDNETEQEETERGPDEVEYEKRVEKQDDMTEAQVAAVHLGLRTLAGMCDGAQAQDGMGFNKFDSRFGKGLAAQASLTPRQAAIGLKMVVKYGRQLDAVTVATARGK